MKIPMPFARQSGMESQWMGRSAAVLYLGGALLGTMTYLFPAPDEADSLGLLLISSLGYPAALALFFLGKYMKAHYFHVPTLGGTLIITIAVVLAGPTSLGASMTNIYVWVPMWICYMFPLWQGMLHVVAIALLSFIALTTVHGIMAPTIWLNVVGTNIIAAVIVGMLAERIRLIARTDALTGAFNLLEWDNAVDREIKRADRTRRPLCLAYLDMDHFKHINDSQGHAAGDSMLCQLTRIAHEQLRSGDVFARIGGDEFALLLPNCPPDMAVEVIERLVGCLPSGCTLSVGIACRREGENGEALRRRADQALYAAKEAGRNTYRIAGN